MIKIGKENYYGILNNKTKKAAEADSFTWLLEETQDKNEKAPMKTDNIENVNNEETVSEAAQTQSNIIVKPDGSRVLVVTTRFAGAEMTMNIKISDATEFPNEVNVNSEDLNNTSNLMGVTES